MPDHDPAARPAPPLLAGRYELLEVLGVGAAGTTRRTRRVADGLEVALKERLLADATSFRELDRLEREADLLARLQHPCLPRLVERFIVEDGPRSAFYLATEYVAGRTLAAELATRTPDWREVLRDLAGILDVLAYLHGRSPAVVHADLTPDNVVRRTDGTLVLVDFHAAQTFPAAREPGLTTGIGTPGYMAPEQLTGYAAPATDVYAAACVALALLTRRPLHTLVDVHHRLAWRDAVVVPAAVRRFLGRLLRPSPARRATDAGALAAEARALAAGPRRSIRRWGGLTALGLACAGVVALVGRVPEGRRAPPGAPAARPVSEVGAAVPPLTALRYPDVPGSACQAEGRCQSLDDGELAQPVRQACVKAPGIVPGLPEHHFTLRVAGMTAFCQARHLGATCMASCALRFKDIGLTDYQQRAEDVAQAIRDRHGRELGHSRWSEGGEQQRTWRWRGTALSLTVRARWRPLPAGTEVPTDIHLDFAVR